METGIHLWEWEGGEFLRADHWLLISHFPDIIALSLCAHKD